MDLVIVATACSMDNPRINGERCTGIRIEVVSEGAIAGALSSLV